MYPAREPKFEENMSEDMDWTINRAAWDLATKRMI